MSNLYTGYEKSPQRAVLKALGLTDAEINKPMVGVIVSASKNSPECNMLDSFADVIGESVKAAGGVSVKLYCHSHSELLTPGLNTGRFMLALRESVADSVEVAVNVNSLDAAVLVGNDDITLAGMVMGACRANIPVAAFCSGGARGAGVGGGDNIFSLLDVMGGISVGKSNNTELERLTEAALNAVGNSGMYFNNGLGFALEALGLSVIGSAETDILSGEKTAIAKKYGKLIMTAITNNFTIKNMINAENVKNAIAADAALGGSGSALLHLLAIAYQLGVNFKKELNVEIINGIYKKTPVLVNFYPSGKTTFADFKASGGMSAVIKELIKNNIMNGESATVAGRFNTQLNDIGGGHIESFGAPYSKSALISIIEPNFAEYGVLRRNLDSVLTNKQYKAKVFNNEEDAVFAIENGVVTEGTALVIRYEGPKAGMKDLTLAAAKLNGRDIAENVLLITDGRLSTYYKGISVTQISGEALAGGFIASLADGDIIELDINKGKLEAKVNSKEMNNRLKRTKMPERDLGGIYLKRFAENVNSAELGASYSKGER